MVASAKADKTKPPVFHPAELARGWRILRQYARISVDLEERKVWGAVNFFICALNYQCISIALNLRRCRIKSVKVNGLIAPWKHQSPLDDDELLNAVSKETMRHRVLDVRHSVKLREVAAAAQGELMVYLPGRVSADVIDELVKLGREDAVTAGEQSKMQFNPPSVPLDQLPLINLSIEYETLDPGAGAIFYGDPDFKQRFVDPLYMLTESRFGMARFWMPCVESADWCDRYLFDFDVSVNADLLVVASGELGGMYKESVFLDGSEMETETDIKRTFEFRSHAPAHASEVIIAVGPFVALPDPALPKTVTHFCLPGHANKLVHTSPKLFAMALSVCRDYFGADPPTNSFKNLFVGSRGRSASTTIAGAGGVVVYSGDILHTNRAIDQAIEAREAFMSGMVMSYFGRFLRPRSGEDEWLIMGLASHITSLGLRHILGRNWYRFRNMDIMNSVENEVSVDLSDVVIERASEEILESIRRRSHVIVYMIERRIGGDMLRRALRDIVAEGRSVTAAMVRLYEISSSKGGNCTFPDSNADQCTTGLSNRTFKSLSGDNSENGVGSGVVATGFDEAQQGVSVGPFLKRLRSICGSDLRSMVRQWASTRGVPRWQIGYQYNGRKHSLELALKQNGVMKGSSTDQEGLFYTGTVQVRVMEIEGSSDHTIEIRDPIFLQELPCHSRRTKNKLSITTEKESNDSVRQSPILWVRVDPDRELCKDVSFRQNESCWTALLKGERDAIAQFEACCGLAVHGSENAAKALLLLLQDGRLYWRVRSKAAEVMATCDGGLKMLIDYFRKRYTDKSNEDLGLLKSNDFSDAAEYFVKRAMIKALALARVKDTTRPSRPGGSVPLDASRFLCLLLATNDNTGNQFDDDDYVADLVNACGQVAVLCVGDERHDKAGGDGLSTTDAIAKQLLQYRSLEDPRSRRLSVVSVSIVKALSEIEMAKLAVKSKPRLGGFSRPSTEQPYQGFKTLRPALQELLHKSCPHDTRLGALEALAVPYSEHLEIALWMLSKGDRTSTGEDRVDFYKVPQRGSKSQRNWGQAESSIFRRAVLNLLCASARYGKSGKMSALQQSLRQHTEKSTLFCIRLLRLAVADCDPRIRAGALRLAKLSWGTGVPVCLLTLPEYRDMRVSFLTDRSNEPKNIAPVKANGGYRRAIQLVKSVKPIKPAKSGRSSKNGKNSKSQKRKATSSQDSRHTSALSRENVSRQNFTSPLVVLNRQKDVKKENDRPKLVEPKSNRGGPVSPKIGKPKTHSAPKLRSEPKKAVQKIPAITIPKSVAVSKPKSSTRDSSAGKLRVPNSKASADEPKLTSVSLARSTSKHASPSNEKGIPSSVPFITIPKSVALGSSTREGNSKLKSTPKSAPKTMPQKSTSVPRSVPRVPRSVPVGVSTLRSVPVNVAPKSVSSNPVKTAKIPKSVQAPNSVPRSAFRSVLPSTSASASKASRPGQRGISVVLPPRHSTGKPGEPKKSSLPFPWHPMDEEDRKFFLKAWNESRARESRRRHLERSDSERRRSDGSRRIERGSSSKRIDRAEVRRSGHHESVRKAHSFDGIRKLSHSAGRDKDALRGESNRRETSATEETFHKTARPSRPDMHRSSEVIEIPSQKNTEPSQPTDSQSEITPSAPVSSVLDGEVKKKKKKKRKRNPEDREDGQRKKKKKRKKHKDGSSKVMDREPNFDDDFTGTAGGEANGAGSSKDFGRIGTMKFRKKSLAPVEKD